MVVMHTSAGVGGGGGEGGGGEGGAHEMHAKLEHTFWHSKRFQFSLVAQSCLEVNVNRRYARDLGVPRRNSRDRSGACRAHGNR